MVDGLGLIGNHQPTVSKALTRLHTADVLTKMPTENSRHIRTSPGYLLRAPKEVSIEDPRRRVFPLITLHALRCTRCLVPAAWGPDPLTPSPCSVNSAAPCCGGGWRSSSRLRFPTMAVAAGPPWLRNEIDRIVQ